MEARYDRAEAFEAVSASNESVTILHSEALHKDSAISIGVSLKFHGNRDIVTDDCLLKWLVGLDTLAISHKDSCVLGGLD